MNRLELRVNERGCNQRGQRFIVDGVAQIAHELVDVLRRGGTKSAPHGF
jgi:hypothetical protein